MKILTLNEVKLCRFEDLYGIYKGLKFLGDYTDQYNIGEYEAKISEKGIEFRLATENGIISSNVPISDIREFEESLEDLDLSNNSSKKVICENLRNKDQYVFYLKVPKEGFGLNIIRYNGEVDFFYSPQQISNGDYDLFFQELDKRFRIIRNKFWTLDASGSISKNLN